MGHLITPLSCPGGSSSTSSKSATIEMFVGSSYNETLSGDLGDTLSQVSDKSSNYFTSDMEHRGRQFQVDAGETLFPRLRICISNYCLLPHPAGDRGGGGMVLLFQYVCVFRMPRVQDVAKYEHKGVGDVSRLVWKSL